MLAFGPGSCWRETAGAGRPRKEPSGSGGGGTVSRPKRRWILALPLIVASLALSGSAAARQSADATAETTSAHRSATQKPAKAEEHRPRRHFAHHVRSPAPDPDEKAPPAPARPSAINRDEVARPVPTV